MGKLKMIRGGPTKGQYCVKHPDRRAAAYLLGSWDERGPNKVLAFYCWDCFHRWKQKHPELVKSHSALLQDR